MYHFLGHFIYIKDIFKALKYLVKSDTLFLCPFLFVINYISCTILCSGIVYTAKMKRISPKYSLNF